MFNAIPVRMKYRYLQAVFILGVIGDGLLAACLMVYVFSGISLFYQYADLPVLRMVADVSGSLMLMVTAALAWGAKNPVNRRGILLIVSLFLLIDRISTLFFVHQGWITVTTLFIITQVCFLGWGIMGVIAFIIAKNMPMASHTS